jgi:maltose alpha-D-glucosyltransferase/alpha-amylase
VGAGAENEILEEAGTMPNAGNGGNAPAAPRNNSLWYKDAIIYELHVRAFYDDNADGVGDFAGLTQKLDYLQDLGVTAIWLLPFYVSPLRDAGYDIADYTAVHPLYGTMRDFKLFLRAAHDRGLRVITELVLNHTSEEHPWFQRARHAPPGSTWRRFYVWSDTPERYPAARVIFKDFEASNWSWDPVAEAYYWHRFYAHQPDLNFDHPPVRKAMLQVVDFWLKLGVDGLRLDAVPYLYEREGTTGENLSETHGFLQEVRAHIDQHYPDRMLLAEANQWPEDAVAYFGTGNECHMAFHFPLMLRLFMSIRREERWPIIDIMAQTPAIPDTAQWALFLRNHDELTLEMVTDEERIYLYRAYAQDPAARVNLGIRRRLAPLLRNDRRRIELLNALLFSLPGTPVIYYGDEIGMGDNIYLGDRNGVRTPMQWSADRNGGFSQANPQQLYLPLIVDHEYHHDSVQVEAQQSNPHSLLAWMRRLIAMRKRYRAFGRGTLEFLDPENRKVLVFLRAYEDEQILVVANLSRFAQHVELDLAAFQGSVPVELFGRVPFPPIGELPYLLTLGPHTFYWFALEPAPVPAATAEQAALPALTPPDGWEALIRGRAHDALEQVLPAYLRGCRWFRGTGRHLLAARIIESVPLRFGKRVAHLGLVRVDYTDSDPQTYVLPLAFAGEKQAQPIEDAHPAALIARLAQARAGRREPGVLYDALADPAVAQALLGVIAQRRRLAGTHGEVVGESRPILRRGQGRKQAVPNPRLVPGDLGNTTLIFGDQWVLKMFRCVDEGPNPEAEIAAFLTDRHFAHTPPFGGLLEYRPRQGSPVTLGVVTRYIAHTSDAWEAAQQALAEYLPRVADEAAPAVDAALPTRALLDLAAQPSPDAGARIGPFLDAIRLLGRRTAELHLALGSDTERREFRPQPFTPYYQRALYQALRRLTSEALDALRGQAAHLPEALQPDAERILAAEPAILDHLKPITTQQISATRIRCHGDYRLEQVLCTGDDFVIIDFEGDPERVLAERRLKRAPFRDVASMLRSFHYAAAAAPAARPAPAAGGDRKATQRHRSRLDAWARYWVQQVSAAFLGEYCRVAGSAPFVPPAPDEQCVLLDTLLLEQVLLELHDAVRRRPDRVAIPLAGLLPWV